jgi:hypothetical protein
MVKAQLTVILDFAKEQDVARFIFNRLSLNGYSCPGYC